MDSFLFIVATAITCYTSILIAGKSKPAMFSYSYINTKSKRHV
jgi:hypothetical protein